MKDFETDVLEQYHIEVKGTRKTRGAIFMRYRQRHALTERTYFLRETSASFI